MTTPKGIGNFGFRKSTHIYWDTPTTVTATAEAAVAAVARSQTIHWIEYQKKEQ